MNEGLNKPTSKEEKIATPPPTTHTSTLPSLLEGTQIADETFGSSLQNSTQIDKWSFFPYSF